MTRMKLLPPFFLALLGLAFSPVGCGGETGHDSLDAGNDPTEQQDSSEEDQQDAEPEPFDKAVPPQFTPPPGTYQGKQILALSTTTPQAKILFTTDGSAPGPSSPQYVSPLPLPEGTTTVVKALTVADGWLDSDIATGVFVIEQLQKQHAEPPVFHPPSGTACNTSLEVSISSATPGAEIHCTSDGSDPSAAKPQCSSPLIVNGITTIKALAIDPGGAYLPSSISSATYNCLTQAAAPSFLPAAGKYKGSQSIVIQSGTAGAVVHYTTDGTVPSLGSTVYSDPITLDSSTTLRAIAVAAGYLNSEVATATYEIEIEPSTVAPVFDPKPGFYFAPLTVVPSTPTPGAEIRCTKDGTDPVQASSLCSGGIVLTTPGTLKARAYAPGHSPSAVTTGYYTVEYCEPASIPPAMSPKGGTFCNQVEVTLSTSQPGGGTIMYTLDGTSPSKTNGTAYTSPIILTTTTTVKAILTGGPFCDSVQMVETYAVISC